MNFDLHVHTIYSGDSIIKPETIIKIAKTRELSGVAVTDHDTIQGAIKVKSLAPDDFVVIIGSEVQTNKGEIIGLFLTDEIKSREFNEVIEEIKDQGGVTVLPHPFRNSRYDPEKLIGKIDLIEGLNGRSSKKLNDQAQNLAKNIGLPMIAGSDAHTPFEIGRVRTIFLDELNTFDMKNLLLKSRREIRGSELPSHLRLISAGIGRFKRDGTTGLIKSCKNKILTKFR